MTDVDPIDREAVTVPGLGGIPIVSAHQAKVIRDEAVAAIQLALWRDAARTLLAELVDLAEASHAGEEGSAGEDPGGAAPARPARAPLAHVETAGDRDRAVAAAARLQAAFTRGLNR